MKVTQIMRATVGAHEQMSIWVDHKLVGTLTLGLGDGEAMEELLKKKPRLDVSKEPHWLYKDFNVLYRVAKRFSEACMGRADDGKPYAAHEALKAQLERLAPAFTDTEEVRKAMRGE